MASRVEFAHKSVILNGCCLMDLYASRQIDSILESLPVPVMVAERVRDREVLRVHRQKPEEGAADDEKIELEPLISAGLLAIASLSSEDDELCFAWLAASLEDDSVATSGALALQRGWALGIDDSWSTSRFNKLAPDLQVLSTPLLLHYWVEQTKPPVAVLRTALQNVQRYARYKPSPQHPLYAWWQEQIGPLG